MSHPWEKDDFAKLVPAELRAECARLFAEGQLEALRVEPLTDGTPPRRPDQARPAAPRLDVPIHPEVPPQWYLEELRAERRGDRRPDPSSRHGRRQLERAMAMADGHALDLEKQQYRDKQRAHQRAYKRRFRWLPTRPSPNRTLGPSRPISAQQLIASRSAVADEWGCRAAVAALPVGIARRIIEWVEGLAPSVHYGSPWSSRLVRRTVATLCAVIYGSRPSWRPGAALVTTGYSRERITEVIGPTPESGRSYSISSLSSTEWGSLGILERLGIWTRQQLPGDAVPAMDRGDAYAFNHYVIPLEVVGRADQWGDPSRTSPSIPPELLERVAPWCVPGDRHRARIAAAREAALEAALQRMNEADDVPDPDLEAVPADPSAPSTPADEAEPPDR